jgi:hypothetical protein
MGGNPESSLSRHPPGLPIPMHLADWLGPLDWMDDAGRYLEADLICPCGAWWYDFLYPGKTHQPPGSSEPIPCTVEVPGPPKEFNFVFGVDAACVSCRRRIGVFDSQNHGRCWLTVKESRPRALDRSGAVPWSCSACGGLPHRARLHFRLVEQDEYLTEYAAVCGRERWGDAFHWFGFTSIQCYACGHRVQDWVGYECD